MSPRARVILATLGPESRRFGHHKPRRSRPDGTRKASDFADTIKAIVKDRNAEPCTRHGGDPDCVEDIESWLSMFDKDDDLHEDLSQYGARGT